VLLIKVNSLAVRNLGSTQENHPFSPQTPRDIYQMAHQWTAYLLILESVSHRWRNRAISLRIQQNVFFEIALLFSVGYTQHQDEISDDPFQVARRGHHADGLCQINRSAQIIGGGLAKVVRPETSASSRRRGR